MNEARQQLIESTPTGFVENRERVTLETVIYKPVGPGPFPTLVFNHGSTGRGDNPTLFVETATCDSIADFFNERGWLVAFPQRRGRGKSGGLYDEGFNLDRTAYSCRPELSLPGAARALSDIEAAVLHLRARPYVDSTRILIGGQSRGGILSVAYAGMHPSHVIGVINFVGGWLGDACPDSVSTNTAIFNGGSVYPKPMLWLYAENDAFYKTENSRQCFNAFVAAGGTGTFNVFVTTDTAHGHYLVSRPEQWSEVLGAYVAQVSAT
jgi:dienelactone hydrolase